MKVKATPPIDIIPDEFKLEKSPDIIAKELSEAVEFKYAREKVQGNQPRVSFLNSSRRLTDSEEKNERYAEHVAKMLGLKYFQEACIAGTVEQLPQLKIARDLISKRMAVGPLKDEKCHSVYKKKFVFYSEDSNDEE